ncbi:MAG TPA: hypothetical protein ENK18_05570 [Deltaproteobacteria bacterium]|nr:hypothetical protein [Deltaproteobacteria bacterium]
MGADPSAGSAGDVKLTIGESGEDAGSEQQLVISCPIQASTEVALVERLEPADRFGGYLSLRAMAEFGYHGDPIAAWRSQGRLEADPAPSKEIGGEPFTGDMLLQAVFANGDQLTPNHCAMVLLWLGALQLDGAVPDKIDAGHLDVLHQMKDASTRTSRTGLVPVGEPVADQLLGFLYRAFLEDQPLRVEV